MARKDKDLPPRCRRIRGIIYYDVPRGKEALWDGKKLFRLGKTVAEMYKVLSEKNQVKKDIKKISELLDRYAVEVIPEKGVRTQSDNIKYIPKLKKVFGGLEPREIIPQYIYQYIDKSSGKRLAKLQIDLLSHALTKAVEWGYINSHPFKGEIRIKNNKPRTRYVEDWELHEALSLKSRNGDIVEAIQAFIEIRYLIAIRPGDLLSIKMTDIREAGIYIKPNKTEKSTGQDMIFEWSPELRRAVTKAINARPVDISPYLFCTKKGACYVDAIGKHSGWDSCWQRFMKRVLAETKVIERFTSYDIRAKSASDAESDERAQELLGHSSVAITKKVYRRKTKMIKPLK